MKERWEEKTGGKQMKKKITFLVMIPGHLLGEKHLQHSKVKWYKFLVNKWQPFPGWRQEPQKTGNAMTWQIWCSLGLFPMILPLSFLTLWSGTIGTYISLIFPSFFICEEKFKQISKLFLRSWIFWSVLKRLMN